MVDEGSVSRWCQAQGFEAVAVTCLGSQASGRTYYRARSSSASRVIMHTPLEEKPAEIGGDTGGDDRRRQYAYKPWSRDPCPRGVLLGPASAPAHARRLR